MRRRHAVRPENDNDLFMPPDNSERRPHRRRDLAAWIALGLVIAIVLVVTTQQHATHSTASESIAAAATAPVTHSSSTTTLLVTPTTVAALGRGTQNVIHQTPARVTITLPTTTLPTTLPTPSTVATPPPTTIAEVPVPSTTTSSWQGQLDYPNDIATAILFSTTGGTVSVSSAWTGVQQLTVTLRCVGRRASRTGLFATSLSLSAHAGECKVSIGELSQPSDAAHYQINATYETNSPDQTGQ